MECYGNRPWRRPPKGIANTCKTKLLHMEQDINISVVRAMWQTYVVTPPLLWQQCAPTPLFTAEGEDMPHIPHSSRSSCCHVPVSLSTCVLARRPDPSVAAVLADGLIKRLRFSPLQSREMHLGITKPRSCPKQLLPQHTWAKLRLSNHLKLFEGGLTARFADDAGDGPIKENCVQLVYLFVWKRTKLKKKKKQ